MFRLPFASAWLLLCLSAFGKDPPSGFNGKWIMDKASSSASSEIPPTLQQEIKHKKTEMSIRSKWTDTADGVTPLVLLGVMVTDLKLKTTGSPAKKQFGPFMTTMSTTQDGDAVVTRWQVNANGVPLSSEWRRSLSPDGQTMTLDIQQTEGPKKSNAKLVFTRR